MNLFPITWPVTLMWPANVRLLITSILILIQNWLLLRLKLINNLLTRKTLPLKTMLDSMPISDNLTKTLRKSNNFLPINVLLLLEKKKELSKTNWTLKFPNWLLHSKLLTTWIFPLKLLLKMKLMLLMMLLLFLPSAITLNLISNLVALLPNIPKDKVRCAGNLAKTRI